MRFYKNILFTFSAIGLANMAIARDATHYPYDSVTYAGKYLRTITNNITGSALALHVDFNFATDQHQLLKQAAVTLSERYISKPVLDCAYANSVKDLPVSREAFISQMKEVMGTKVVEDAHVPTYIFVARYAQDKESVGIGFLNLYYDTDQQFPGYSDRHYLYVALNDEFLGKPSYGYGTDAEYWAGVLGHEILHNLNFDHKTGYSGSFISEYGKCIWKNGVQSDIPEGSVIDKTVEREM